MPKGPVSNFTTTSSLTGSPLDARESGEGPVTRFGNFEVLTNPDGGLHLLGGGGFGKTYKARHVYLDQIVALKVINDRLLHDASIKERFLREAQVVHQLRHPNIAHVLDFGEVKHSLYYAMEFCGGGNLENMVSRVGPLPLPMALRCARQLTEALGCAHSHGFIHRDVKPANVMLMGSDDGNPQIKLVDFGLVKPLQGGGSEATAALTATGQQFFTIQFASPEQLMEEELDPRSDLFALGMTIWFLLKGSAPEAGSMASIVARRLDGKSYEAQLPPGLPEAHRALLARLLEKDRTHRFQNTDEVLAALAAAEAVPGTVPGEGATGEETVVLPRGPAAGAAPAEPRSILELYTVLENLGPMPLGTLYRATSNRDDEQVAITMIGDALREDPAQRAVIAKNAALLQTRPHETMAEVYGLEEYKEGLALVQEWHRGVSLQNILKSARSIHYPDALRVLLPIAQGTDWTTRQGLPGVVLAMDEIYLRPLDAGACPDPAKLLDTPLKSWPAFRVRLLPYVIREDTDTDIGRTLNTEIVSDPAVAFACLLYHLVAGHAPRAASRLSKSAYVTIGRFTEDSNRLLAACIAGEQDFGGCEGVLRALNANEGVSFSSGATTGQTLPDAGASRAEPLAVAKSGVVEARRPPTGGGALPIARPPRDLAREAEEIRAKKEAEAARLRQQQEDEERARKEAEEARLRQQQAEEERARKEAAEKLFQQKQAEDERLRQEAAEKLLRQKQAEEAQAKKLAEEERLRQEAAEKLLRQRQAEEAQAKKLAEEERARKEAEAKQLKKQQAEEERARKEAEARHLKHKQEEEARAKKQADEERAKKEAEAARLRKQQAEEERARKEAADKLLRQQQAEEARLRQEAAEKLLRQRQAEEAQARKLAEEERARQEAAEKLLRQQQAEEARAKKQAEEERAKKEAEAARLRKQELEEERARQEAADKLLRQQQAEEARAKKLAAQTLKPAAVVEPARPRPEIAPDEAGERKPSSGLPPGVSLAAIAASVALVAVAAFVVLHKQAPPRREAASPTPVAVNTPKPTPTAAPTAVPLPGQFVFRQGIVPVRASITLNGQPLNPTVDGAKVVVPLDGARAGDSLSVEAPGYESRSFPITGGASVDGRVELRRHQGAITFQFVDGTSDYATAVFKPLTALPSEEGFVRLDPQEPSLTLSAGARESLPTGTYRVTLRGRPSDPQIQGRVLTTRFSVTTQRNVLTIPPSLAGRYPFEFVFKQDVQNEKGVHRFVEQKVQRTIVIDPGLQTGYADDVYGPNDLAKGTKITDLTLNDRGVLHGFIRFTQRTDGNIGCDEQFELSYTDGGFVVVSGGWEIQPPAAEMARMAQKQSRLQGYKAQTNQPAAQTVKKQ